MAENAVAGDFRIQDTSRQPSPTSCPDCGRTHLNGEHVEFRVVTPEPGVHRLVWEGCVDCWIKRTNPVKQEGDGG